MSLDFKVWNGITKGSYLKMFQEHEEKEEPKNKCKLPEKAFTHIHWNVVLKSFWLDFLISVCSYKMLGSGLEKQEIIKKRE